MVRDEGSHQALRGHQLVISDLGGTAPPSVLPDISPSSGEIRCRKRFRQFSPSKKRRWSRRYQSPPLRQGNRR
ncbi:hypothetical protein EOA16_32230 [Mesorhizobium sp. M7A.F.Ca.US.008.03.1.1]|nr:hypothetical protein EOA16_32230 [Mesorhizobium sp. M7A.F.Ca.US.008.03.1.1]